ncbi:MAG: NeuD/PglB/VioB family sugar acetyltransferase [Bacteroidetes bacterium]|nr:NeuD/PglB/VioB family sugar acetyltransferase [Bacteroidota bacterium]MBL6964373.1 NeuD/PglB/VioB family sugar acetyltransferase [Bacteroidota bacterium]
MQELVILGAGENGVLVTDVVKDINSKKVTFKIIGFLDDDEKKLGAEIAGYPVMGRMNTWRSYKKAVFTSPLVSSPKKNHLKKVIVSNLGIEKSRFVNIISPDVVFFRSVSVGLGNLILSSAQFQSNITLGSYNYVSNNSVIGSNAFLEDYVNISNSASIQGGVRIGEGAYIGANSSIIGYTSVGKWAIVGMGSVVLQDVKDYEIVAGNPARVIGENTTARELFERL